MNPSAHYRQTQAETASPSTLMMMMMHGALRFMRQGRTALEAGETQAAGHALGRATDIVTELAATLDPRRAPELCEQLAGVYDFVSLRLLDASLKQDLLALEEAERIFSPIVDGFAQAVASLESKP